MEEKFTDSTGRKRIGVRVICANCKNEFITRKDQPAKYCCKNCSSQSSRSQVDLICECCGLHFKRPKSKLKVSKSGLYFCSRKCKDESQKLGGIDAIMPDHYGVSTPKIRNSNFYRRIYKQHNNLNSLCCERCNYCEFECGIDIHHKDGDCKNNDKDNLASLCAPCHRALHMGLWKLKT